MDSISEPAAATLIVTRGRCRRARAFGDQSRANTSQLASDEKAAEGCVVNQFCSLEWLVKLTTSSSCPTGCNPSGCSASKERKLEVLEVCRKYGLLMFEGESRSGVFIVYKASGFCEIANAHLDFADDPYCAPPTTSTKLI